MSSEQPIKDVGIRFFIIPFLMLITAFVVIVLTSMKH